VEFWWGRNVNGISSSRECFSTRFIIMKKPLVTFSVLIYSTQITICLWMTHCICIVSSFFISHPSCRVVNISLTRCLANQKSLSRWERRRWFKCSRRNTSVLPNATVLQSHDYCDFEFHGKLEGPLLKIHVSLLICFSILYYRISKCHVKTTLKPGQKRRKYHADTIPHPSHSLPHRKFRCLAYTNR